MKSWKISQGLIILAFLFLVFGGNAEAACGAPGQSACACGWLNLGKCCDYDYLPLIGKCSDSAGFPTFCGGTNEAACKVWQHLKACKSGRINIGGTCRAVDGDGYPTGCGGTNESACSLYYQIALGISACKSGLTEIPFTGGTCRRLDSDGFPSFCGGQNERPCTVFEHFPSCKPSLFEIPFPGGDCTQLDSDGFPPFCGGVGERACKINEHFPSCKPQLLEIDGTCDGFDADGYPTLCGDVGEPACSIIVQTLLLKPGCKPSTVPGRDVAEIPFGFGTCTLLDEDGFPSFCGGELERPCLVLEHFPSCKRDFEEDFLANVCRDTYPAACGRNGQRPCLVFEKLIQCKWGLSARGFDFGECGENPDSWSATEVPRGGPRSVFYIHGRGGDLSDFANSDASLFHRLLRETPNVKQVYGVDWNAAAGSAERKLTIRRLLLNTEGSCTGVDGGGSVCEDGLNPGGSCTTDAECHVVSVESRTFGTIDFNVDNFRVYQIAQALSEAILELPTEKNITIITHSYGGVIGRQLVYRHYDELRNKGKRIAEMVTLMAPHLGGGMAVPNVSGGGAQTSLACGLDLINVDRTEWHNVCELGKWHEFRQRREDGILGPPFGSHYIDDRDYPQIRWINMAQNGSRLTVTDELGSDIDPSSLGLLSGAAQTFLDAISSLDTYDSDGTILTSSEFGIEADECYPFTRTAGPQDKPIEIAPLFRENYLTDDNGVKIPGSEWTVLSAQCHHPGARVDPRYNEREDLRNNHSMGDPDIHDFVVAVLSLEGDTNGDGVVDSSDQTVVAKAGPDTSVECTGSLTDVVLDGSASDDPAAGGLIFDWSGAFGAISGMTPTVSLALGLDTVSLAVQDSLGRTATDSINVTVADTTPPSINAGDDVDLEATSVDGAEVPMAPSASDVCGTASVSVSPQLSVFPLGTTEVTITATDESGNEVIVTRAVVVADTTPPEIVAPASLVREATDVLSVVVLGQATATDIFPVDVTSDAPQEGFPLRTTVVTWTARDENGNETDATQDVTVEDTTPPVISVPADVTAEATAIVSPLPIGTATATDIFEVTVTSNAPAGYPYGETFVDWIATDTHENEASGRQRVTVVDTTAPQIDVPADVTVEATAILSSLAIGTATATDIFDVIVTSDAPVDGYPLGETIVGWTATDIHDNASGGDQRVTVVDTTAPALDVPADVSVLATGPATQVELGQASATDIFEPVSVANDAPAAGFAPGITVVTWTAVDANGNQAAESQNVHATYVFSGFAPPLHDGGIYKANRTLPIKFELHFAAGEAVAGAVATLSVVPLGSDDTPGEPLDIETGEAADSGATFRATGDGYHYNLSTQGLASGRYRIIVSIDDDTTQSMDIILR